MYVSGAFGASWLSLFLSSSPAAFSHVCRTESDCVGFDASYFVWESWAERIFLSKHPLRRQYVLRSSRQMTLTLILIVLVWLVLFTPWTVMVVGTDLRTPGTYVKPRKRLLASDICQIREGESEGLYQSLSLLKFSEMSDHPYKFIMQLSIVLKWEELAWVRHSSTCTWEELDKFKCLQ